MNKKNFFTVFFIGIFFLSAGKIFSAPINLSHKSGKYENIFDLEIKFSEPVKKILRTRNPNGSPDEMFVYEEKIPIKYSQDIWYFGLLDGYRATNFFVNKYKLRIDPNKFNYGFKISKFSPNGDWVEIRNEGKNERMAIGRKISGLNFEEKIKDFRLKKGETKKIFLENKIGDDMDRIKLLDPNGQTQFRIQFKQNIGENRFFDRNFGGNKFFIKKF